MELFHVFWKEHRSNLLPIIEDCLNTAAFTDVTLACDGRSIKCHKMVLWAGSFYFQELFTEDDSEDSIFVLNNIKFIELKWILDYMYRGKVNLTMDQVACFLKTAERFKLKGMVDAQAQLQHQREIKPDRHELLNQQLPQQHLVLPGQTANSGTVHQMYEGGPSTSPERIQGGIEVGAGGNNEMAHNKVPLPSTRFSIMGRLLVEDTRSYHKLPTRHNSGVVNVNTHDDHEEPEPLVTRKSEFSGISEGFEFQGIPSVPAALNHTNLNPYHPISLRSTEPFQFEPLDYSMSTGTSDGTKNEKGRNAWSQNHMLSWSGASTSSTEADDPSETNHPINLSPGFNYKNEFASAAAKIGLTIPKQVYKNYTNQDMAAAEDAVLKTGMSALEAARKFCVPTRTLYCRTSKRRIKRSTSTEKGSKSTSEHQQLENNTDEMDSSNSGSFSPTG